MSDCILFVVYHLFVIRIAQTPVGHLEGFLGVYSKCVSFMIIHEARNDRLPRNGKLTSVKVGLTFFSETVVSLCLVRTRKDVVESLFCRVYSW